MTESLFADELNEIIKARMLQNDAKGQMQKALSKYIQNKCPDTEEDCFALVSQKDNEIVMCFYVYKDEDEDGFEVELDCDPQRNMTLIFID